MAKMPPVDTICPTTYDQIISLLSWVPVESQGLLCKCEFWDWFIHQPLTREGERRPKEKGRSNWKTGA